MVHRDYSNLGRDVKVGIYDDRIEIISPGGLPSGLTNADLASGRSEIRNKVIARVLKELEYIEQWGSGINRIKDICKEIGLEEPFIQETGDFVGVRIFRNTKKIVITDRDGLTTDRDGSATDYDKIIDYIKENKKIKTKDVKKILNAKDTKAKNILKEMINKNLIQRQGQGSATYYVIKKDV